MSHPDYGPSAVQPPLSQQEYDRKKTEVEKSFEVTEADRKLIEEKTRLQNDPRTSVEWHHHKYGLLLIYIIYCLSHSLCLGHSSVCVPSFVFVYLNQCMCPIAH